MLFMTSIVFSMALANAHPSIEQWAAQWGINSVDESMRSNYANNCDAIDRLNEEHSGATFKVNEFAGMSYQEFSAKFLMEMPEPADSDLPRYEVNRPEVEVADHVSWAITDIRTQTCGSCWDFAAVAMIESGALARGAPHCIDLAEKEILDCGGGSCDGGRAESAFRVVENKKIYTEQSCKWTGNAEACSACDGAGVPSGITISGYHRGLAKTEDSLMQELQHDAVAVYVNADQAFALGWTGINSKPTTGACSINHVVLMMGYDFTGPVPYWQIKNSWGPYWSESGTARFARTTEACGPFEIFKEYHVQADGINIADLAPCPPPTPPPPTPKPTPPPAPTPPAPPGWCCQNANCSVDSCFAHDMFCTKNGPEKCVNNCGGHWCPEPAPTPSPSPAPTPTPAPPPTPMPPPTPKPTGWCCGDVDCAVPSCFPSYTFCTINGPDTCLKNCSGHWCPEPSPTPPPTPPAPTPPGSGWCCQDANCATASCFNSSMFCTKAGPEKCVQNCGGTWCPRPAPTPKPPPTPPAPPAPPSPSPTPKPAPKPTPPAVTKCCWSNWGAADECGGYPTGSQGGRCNTDWSKSCSSIADCSRSLNVV